MFQFASKHARTPPSIYTQFIYVLEIKNDIRLLCRHSTQSSYNLESSRQIVNSNEMSECVCGFRIEIPSKYMHDAKLSVANFQIYCFIKRKALIATIWISKCEQVATGDDAFIQWGPHSVFFLFFIRAHIIFAMPCHSQMAERGAHISKATRNNVDEHNFKLLLCMRLLIYTLECNMKIARRK